MRQHDSPARCNPLFQQFLHQIIATNGGIGLQNHGVALKVTFRPVGFVWSQEPGVAVEFVGVTSRKLSALLDDPVEAFDLFYADGGLDVGQAIVVADFIVGFDDDF